MRKKRKGFLLIEGILQIVILGLVAIGFAALFSSQFTALTASKTAIDARQMAELEAAYIKKIGYEDFNSAEYNTVDENGFHENGVHDTEIMTNFGGKSTDGGFGDRWYSKVSIVGVDKPGDDATIEKINGEDDNYLKIARIEIFRAKDGEPNAAPESTSRYSLEVPLSSLSDNGVKVGTVVTWPTGSDPAWLKYGNYIECNGQTFDTSKYARLYKVLGSNRVPDYRGLFLRGSGTYDGKHGSGGIGSVQGDATLEYRTLAAGIFSRGLPGFYANVKSHYSTSEIPYYLPNSPVHTGWCQNFLMWGRAYQSYPEEPFRYKYKLVSSGGGTDTEGKPLPTSYSLVEEKELFPDVLGYHEQAWVVSNRLNAPIADEIRPINTAVRYFIKAR